jgi:hypothetical protein
MSRKICVYCGKRKNKKSFYKHRGHKDRLDTRCKKCMGRNIRITNKLKKKSPEKPDVCECCNKLPEKWCFDHDHSNNSFRGWLCDPCNTGIGKLGDDIAGILNALEYLLKRTDLTIPQLNIIRSKLIISLNSVLERQKNSNG